MTGLSCAARCLSPARFLPRASLARNFRLLVRAAARGYRVCPSTRWQDRRSLAPPRAGLDHALVKTGRSTRAQSLSNHLRQLPDTAADLLFLCERDREAQPVRGPTIVTKLEPRRENHARAHRVRQKVPGIDPARKLHPDLMSPFGRRPARAIGHLGAKSFHERIPATQKRPAHPPEMAVVSAAFHEVRKSGLEHERAAEVGRLLECQNAVEGAPAGRDTTYPCAGEKRFREREQLHHEASLVERGERRNRLACVTKVHFVGVLDHGL